MSWKLGSRGAVLIASLAGALTCTDTRAQPARPVAASKVDMDGLIDRLQPLLNASGKGAVVYYDGICTAALGGQVMAFPGVDLGELGPKEGNFSAIRSSFPKAIVEERLGILSIKLGFVPSDLLATRIHTLRLGDSNYDDYLAVMAIEQNPDVEAAGQRLGYGHTIGVINRLVQMRAKGLPHLPATLKNLTLDQAIGRVATTFRAIVFVGTCQDKRVLQLDVGGGYRWERNDR